MEKVTDSEVVVVPLVKKWIKLVLLICVVDAAMVFKSYNFLASARSGDLFLFQTEISKIQIYKISNRRSPLFSPPTPA